MNIKATYNGLNIIIIAFVYDNYDEEIKAVYYSENGDVKGDKTLMSASLEFLKIR